MGASSCCCCQKTVPGALASSQDKDKNSEHLSADDVFCSEPAEEDSKAKARSAPQRGKAARVGKAGGGAAAADAGPGEQPHLDRHKTRRDKGMKTRELIRSGMTRDRVCALLESAEIEMIMETMDYFQFAAGETIVKQGDAGQYFFVAQEGGLEVSVNGKVVNTLGSGLAFGGLALLYQCPRTATVVAKQACGIWGANGETFHRVLQENSSKNQEANRKFLDSISLFDGLSGSQKELVGQHLFLEVFEPGHRVVTEGETANAIYFVKKGELSVIAGATINQNGSVEGGNRISQAQTGDCFGERSVLYNEPRGSTVVADVRCELLVIGIEQLKEVLGNDLAACLERNFILSNLKKSPIISLFSSSQQYQIVRVMEIRTLQPGASIEEGLRFAVVMDGQLKGMDKEKGCQIEMTRGQWYEDDSLNTDGDNHVKRSPTAALMKLEQQQGALMNLEAGPKGLKLAALTKDGLAQALKELGLAAIGSAEQAIDYTRKMLLAKKVAIFRHLSQAQTDNLVKSFVLQKYKKGALVIKAGETGTSFFVIASGEVTILNRAGEKIRTLGKNAYIGERALLFDEPRSATVKVESAEAELWSVEKSTFSDIVKGKMQEELVKRIRLQDTTVTMKDLKHLKLIGAGAAGVVRLVEHTKTKMTYALKRVKKTNGKIPEEVSRECALLGENDHPFIMHLVKTFETANSVYMLTELITGGELHAAIRKIPTVLSKPQAQFYAGSMVLVLESLQDRNIVYRDLKPENVMLDAQGYLKLIDFGIAKKLQPDSGQNKTFTMIGTPHYMAPEVMRGHGYGTEVDIWSLGVMMFEFVCGYLPFADELDDPTEVCTAVLKDALTFPAGYRDKDGRTLMQGMLCRQPKKRLGAGINGYEDIKEAEFFKAGHAGGVAGDNLFNKIMGRELDPPVAPQGETYCDEEDVREIVLSDSDELGR